MFAIFSLTSKLSCNNLPASVNQSPYMVLCWVEGYTKSDNIHTYNEDMAQMDSEKNLPAAVPLKLTSAHQLKTTQTKLHDILQKCISVVYYNTSIGDLQRAVDSAS